MNIFLQQSSAGYDQEYAQLTDAYVDYLYTVPWPTKHYQCIRLWHERGSQRSRKRTELLRRRMYV